MIIATNSTRSRDGGQVINLRERFGKQYRVNREESHDAEYGCHTKIEDPALLILPCRFGHIFPWGQDRLAASTDTRGAIANRLAALSCCRVEQDADDGVTVSFRLDDFRAVAKIVKPRGRRTLSPERRRAFVEAGRAARFTSRSPGRAPVSATNDGRSSPTATSKAIDDIEPS